LQDFLQDFLKEPNACSMRCNESQSKVEVASFNILFLQSCYENPFVFIPHERVNVDLSLHYITCFHNNLYVTPHVSIYKTFSRLLLLLLRMQNKVFSIPYLHIQFCNCLPNHGLGRINPKLGKGPCRSEGCAYVLVSSRMWPFLLVWNNAITCSSNAADFSVSCWRLNVSIG